MISKLAMLCTLVISNIFILILKKNNETNILIYKVTKLKKTKQIFNKLKYFTCFSNMEFKKKIIMAKQTLEKIDTIP